MFFVNPFPRTQAQETAYNLSIPLRNGTRSKASVSQSSMALYSTESSGVIRQMLLPNGLIKNILVMRTEE